MDASVAVQLGAMSDLAPHVRPNPFVQPACPIQPNPLSFPSPSTALLCACPPPPPPCCCAAAAAKSHYAESGRGGRARSRLQGRLESGWSDPIAADHADPVGELSCFPLIPCPECGHARWFPDMSVGTCYPSIQNSPNSRNSFHSSHFITAYINKLPTRTQTTHTKNMFIFHIIDSIFCSSSILFFSLFGQCTELSSSSTFSSS